MIQKILSIENEKKKKKRYKSIYHVNKKNEFNEDDDWFDRLLIEHAVRKEKLNFLFLKSTSSDTLLKSKILIIRVKEVISISSTQLGTAVSISGKYSTI